MKAVILAGGKGTRLGELTAELPKPMIPVGDKPILEHQLDMLARYGVEEAFILVNHLKQPIIDHFGDGPHKGVRISYFEEPYPMGTVGGLKEIEDQLTEDFLVLYGDVMMDIDLQRLITFHQEKNSEATLVVHPNDHPYDSDLLEVDNQDRVTDFHPKPHQAGRYYANMVNAAVYVFSNKIFNFLEKGKKADFGKDIFPAIYNKMRMFGYNTTEYLKDMGTPDRLDKVRADLESGKIAARNLSNPQKAIFLDRDGVLNEDRNLIHTTEEYVLYPFAASALKMINSSSYLAILATNQSVVARNLCTIEGLQEIHQKMETELGEERAKLDAIYFCPHHPDKGFPEENPEFKIDCPCRKPKPGMLTEAADRFHVDLSRSWMVGDSERDIQAGIAAGCSTIGVATGNGLKKSNISPDFFFSNVEEAARFVIEDPLKEDADKVMRAILDQDKDKVVLSLGGNTRTGKSTFAAYLERSWRLQSKKVFRIQLDDWILPKDRRPAGANVFERFQVDRMSQDIQKILQGETVKFPAYRKHHAMPDIEVTYAYQQEPIILLDGVVALSVPFLRELSDIKVFFHSDMGAIKRRLHQFYSWKGYEPQAIDEIFSSRQLDEYELIEPDARYADILINSDYDHY